MQKFTSFLELYAGSVLRYAMAGVILWFSIQQFIDTESWTVYVPDSIVAMTHLSVTALVYINAIFELVFGILLLLGFQIRIVALLLSLHLFDIMFTIGYGQIAVRDFGLAMATLVVCMNGPDLLSIQGKKKVVRAMPPSPPSLPSSSPSQRHAVDPLRQPRRLV